MLRRNRLLTALFVCLALMFSFSPACQSAKGYEIGPGDVLMISVWGDEDLTREVVVSPEGVFSFPLIGEVRAAGCSAEEVRRTISERLADGYLVDPQVEVVIREYKSQKVYVLGEVVRPGTYPIERKASILEIISKAGGLGEEAGDAAQIIRGGNQSARNGPLKPNGEGVNQVLDVDLRGLLAGKVNRESLEIQDGDTIFIPKVDVFYIYGQVAQPGKYRWEKDLTVLKAVITAGGFTDIASKRRIKIQRKESEEEEKKIRARLDTPVEPGDTVIVPESFF
jgi:polysaccharide export outer membrane protein